MKTVRQNLMQAPPFSRMDLILCRNVLIYMKPVLQGRILSNLHLALKPAGYLLPGSSGSVREQADLFKAFDRQAVPHGLPELPGTAENGPARGLEKVHRDADRAARPWTGTEPGEGGAVRDAAPPSAGKRKPSR